MEWFSRLVDIVKLPARYCALAAFVSGGLLFLPDTTIHKLHLETAVQKYGVVVGLVFLVSCGLVVIHAVAWVGTSVNRRRIRTKSRAMILDHLAQLDSNERAVLREFYLGNNTIKLPIDHPVVTGLIARGILQRVGSLGQHGLAGMLFPCRLSSIAKELITPTILGLEPYLIKEHFLNSGEWRMTEEGIRWITANRPHFVHDIAREDALFRRF